MKKKHRDIVVNNKTYGWTVSYMGHLIRIWVDNKIVHEVKCNGYIPIKPSLIEEIIIDNKI